MTTTPDYSTTSLQTITVEKAKLLEKLRENRQTHEEIYKAACDGYWIKVQETLKERKQQFAAAIDKTRIELESILAKGQTRFDEQYATFDGAIAAKETKPLTSFDAVQGKAWNVDFGQYWVDAHPVTHIDSYDRAISMLEFSVADKVNLTVNEFDAYVRNNWSWKNEFAETNLGYVRAVTGFMQSSAMISGGSILGSKLYSYASNGASAL